MKEPGNPDNEVCLHCPAMIFCMKGVLPEELKPIEKSRCERCGRLVAMCMAHNLYSGHTKQAEYDVTIECPLPEAVRARPLCIRCYDALGHKEGSFPKWIKDGRPRLHSYQANLRRSQRLRIVPFPAFGSPQNVDQDASPAKPRFSV